MKEPQGIKNTKEMIKLGADLARIIKQAKENDGKIDLNDVPLLIGLAGSFGPAIDGADLIVLEIKDIDSAEAIELIKYTGEQLEGSFSDEEILKKIQACVAWGIATANVIKAF